MDTELEGSKAMITGGGTGVGLGIAVALAQEGVDIAIVSRTHRSEPLQKLRDLGIRAEFVEADVSRESDVIRAVAETIEKLGGLDLVVNNSAIALREPITRMTAHAWVETMNTNLSACVYLCRESIRHMVSQGRGSVLVVGSTAAHVPLYTETAYRASKSGLKAIVEVMAIEMAPYEIRVNLLTPGAFPTAMHDDLPDDLLDGRYFPLRRMGAFEEIGSAAAFLLSDKLSGYTTGSELVVDGGFRLRPLDLYSHEELLDLNQPQL